MTTKKINKNIIKKNLAISVATQAISLMISFLFSMIVPKFISIESYAYWQTYLLYASYAGILQFGLLDGMILRYSKYDYDELDKIVMRSQFCVLLGWTSLLCIGTIFISSFLVNGISFYLVVLISFSIISKNIIGYFSYLLQMTNRISKYAVLTLMQRISYGVLVLGLLFGNIDNFKWFCMADLFGDLLGIIIGCVFNKGLYFGSVLPLGSIFKELKENIFSGLLLMVANWSAMLLTSGAKFFVQWRWDTKVFGVTSFSFSLSNLFLSFITALSVVVFPTMKRMDEDELPNMYRKLRGMISIFLIVALISYFPFCYILSNWVPKYKAGLTYLGIIMPTMIFNSKITLLTNNYLKVYRKEKKMLLINLISVLIAVLFYTISAYCMNSLQMLLFFVVFVAAFRSILSEIVVMKTIDNVDYKDFILEILIVVLFIIIVKLFSLLIGFILYLLVVSIYLCYKKCFDNPNKSSSNNFDAKLD